MIWDPSYKNMRLSTVPTLSTERCKTGDKKIVPHAASALALEIYAPSSCHACVPGRDGGRYGST